MSQWGSCNNSCFSHPYIAEPIKDWITSGWTKGKLLIIKKKFSPEVNNESKSNYSVEEYRIAPKHQEGDEYIR